MSVKCMLAEQVKGSGGSAPIVLQRIAVTTPPTKTDYETGESFDTAGMVVTGYYGPSASMIVAEIALTGYSYSPSTFTTTGDAITVTITYSRNGVTKTTTMTVMVAAPFEWGSETASGAGNATWWANLQNAVKKGRAQSSWVGKTKSVTLTSSVLGATTHLIRCIGINQDGTNTVTFQTKNCLPTGTTFSSNAQWIGSNARTYCANYYNAFPGKAYIKTVSKGTCTNASDSTATYNNETVWIPSIYEVGLGSYYNRPYGEEYTNGCSTAYSYYSSNTNRKKYESDSSSTARVQWTRSRSSVGMGYVCDVEKDGSADYYFYSGAGYLAPAFVIG